MQDLTGLFTKALIAVVIFVATLSASAQVHVKGYYRSNGTHVQPHERTRPNYTVTDNYSYPGNYNPNDGRTTGGNNYPNSSSQSNNATSSPSTTNSYSSSSFLKNPRHYSGTYPYTTKFDNPTILPPLRSSPTPNFSEIYTCPKGASVNVLEKISNSGYCRVLVDGHTGYVSQALLRLPNTTYASATPYAPARPTTSYTGSITAVSFQTRFDNPTINPPLRSAPTIEAEEIYSCPRTAVVYVQGDVSNSIYCQVTVNGRTGFVSKALLVRQP